jgi:hypothetical protein
MMVTAARPRLVMSGRRAARQVDSGEKVVSIPERIVPPRAGDHRGTWYRQGEDNLSRFRAE